MISLDQLCTKHNCDKGSWAHSYMDHYESVLGAYRDKPIKLLEIGVGDGKSIRVWLDYFTHKHAQIVGVDNWEGCIKTHEDPRYVFIKGDQTDVSFWRQAIVYCFDVIIDDGAHMSNGTIPSFEYLWPFVKPGGYYIIEDLRTSYMAGYQVPGWPSQMFFIKQLLDDINAQTNYMPGPDKLYYPQGTDGGRGIEWMRFSEELCILKKK
jgi:hypothetical protein